MRIKLSQFDKCEVETYDGRICIVDNDLAASPTPKDSTKEDGCLLNSEERCLVKLKRAIEAIRLVRTRLNLGLRESKAIVDQFRSLYNIPYY